MIRLNNHNYYTNNEYEFFVTTGKLVQWIGDYDDGH